MPQSSLPTSSHPLIPAPLLSTVALGASGHHQRVCLCLQPRGQAPALPRPFSCLVFSQPSLVSSSSEGSQRTRHLVGHCEVSKAVTELSQSCLIPGTSQGRDTCPQCSEVLRTSILGACEFSHMGLGFCTKHGAGGEGQRAKPTCWELARFLFYFHPRSPVCFSDGKLSKYLHSGLLLSQGPGWLWPDDTVAIGTEVAGQGWLKHPAVRSPPGRH